MPRYTEKELETLLQFALPREEYEEYIAKCTIADKKKIFSFLGNVDFSQPISPLFQQLSDSWHASKFLAEALFVLSSQSLIKEFELLTVVYTQLMEEHNFSNADERPSLPVLMLGVVRQHTDILCSHSLSNRHWQWQAHVLDCLAQAFRPDSVLIELSNLYKQDLLAANTFMEEPVHMRCLSKEGKYYLQGWHRLYRTFPDLARDGALLSSHTNWLAFGHSSIDWNVLTQDRARTLLLLPSESVPLVSDLIKKHPTMLLEQDAPYLDSLLAKLRDYPFLVDNRLLHADEQELRRILSPENNSQSVLTASVYSLFNRAASAEQPESFAFSI